VTHLAPPGTLVSVPGIIRYLSSATPPRASSSSPASSGTSPAHPGTSPSSTAPPGTDLADVVYAVYRLLTSASAIDFETSFGTSPAPRRPSSSSSGTSLLSRTPSGTPFSTGTSPPPAGTLRRPSHHPFPALLHHLGLVCLLLFLVAVAPICIPVLAKRQSAARQNVST
jgi:hypothetical protein